MSWLERCYQTYEYIRRAEPDLIGRQEPNRATLLPVTPPSRHRFR